MEPPDSGPGLLATPKTVWHIWVSAVGHITSHVLRPRENEAGQLGAPVGVVEWKLSTYLLGHPIA